MNYAEIKEKLLNDEDFKNKILIYQLKNNLIDEFINEKLRSDSAVKTLAADIYMDFLIWCRQKKYQPMSQNRLGRELTKRGFSQRITRADNGKMGSCYELMILQE